MAKAYIDIAGDKTITIPVLDSAGAAEDLSGYEGYALILYYKDGTILQKYSKNAVTGYDNTNISTADEANGNVDIYLQRSLTENGRNDQDVWVKVIIQEVDVNYASSQSRDFTTAKYCFTFRYTPVNPTVDVS